MKLASLHSPRSDQDCAHGGPEERIPTVLWTTPEPASVQEVQGSEKGCLPSEPCPTPGRGRKVVRTLLLPHALRSPEDTGAIYKAKTVISLLLNLNPGGLLYTTVEIS